MSVAQERKPATPEPGSDRAVVEAVRAGEIGQFALLYQRYQAEALRIARRQVGPDEAQDLVQEAFARVLRAIRAGGGPTEDVAGYVFRTLRNLRIDRSGQREFATDDVETAGPAGLWVVPDSSDEVLDRGLVADAFAELPPRWREVLWLTEVEGVGPSELADRMGIKTTAVSTLSLRARAGFRSAWLQAHVGAGEVPSECRPVQARLGDYQTGRLTARREEQVRAHLQECDRCPMVVAELAYVSDSMGALLLPVVVLAPKALWWVFGGWAVKAGFLLWGAKVGLTRLREPKVAASSVGGAVAVAAAVALAMAMTAPPDPPPAAGSTTAQTPATSAPTASASAASDSSDDAAASTAPGDRGREPADPPDAATAVPPSPPAAADPDDPPAAPESVSDPATPPADPAPNDSAPQPTSRAPRPTSPAPTDPAPESSEPTPEPTEPAPEPEDPVTPPPDPLVVTNLPGSGGVVYTAALDLVGTAGVPGASIVATAANGQTVATGNVADDGTWAVSIEEPGSAGGGDRAAGGIPGSATGGSASRGVAARDLADIAAEHGLWDCRGLDAVEGEACGGTEDSEGYYFTLTQTVAEGTSNEYAGESEAVTLGPFTWVAPLTVVDPTAADPVQIHGNDWIWVEFERECGTGARLLLGDREVSLAHGPGERCDTASGLLTDRAHLHGITPGQYDLTVQYLNDEGQTVGHPVSVHFTAE